MKRIYIFIFFLSFILAPTRLFAANIVWLGTTASWNAGTNWVGGVKPGVNDIAEFGANNTACTIDLNPSVAGILIKTGYTQTISRSINTARTVTVGASGFVVQAGSTATFNLNNGTGNGILSMSAANGPYTQAGGTVTLGAGSSNLGTGAFALSAGNFNCGNGTTTLGGTVTVSGGTFTASSLSSASLTFNSSFSQTAGAFSGGTKAITILGAFSLSGTAAFTSTSGTLNIQNTFSNSATFTHNNGTTKFSAGSFTLTGSTTFNKLVFDASGSARTYTIADGTILTVSTDLQYLGNAALIINSGTGEIDLAGTANYVFLSNTVVGGDGTALIRFISTANYVIQGASTSGYSALCRIVMDDGSVVTFGSGGNEFISLATDFTNNSLTGSFGCDAAATVIFSGTTTLSGTADFYFSNVVVNSGNTLTAPNASNLYVSGSFTNNGTFTHNSGSIIFNGSSTIDGTSSATFNNFIVDGVATAVVLPNTVNIAGDYTDNSSPSVLDATTNATVLTFNSTVANQVFTTTDLAATLTDVVVDNSFGGLSFNTLTDLTLQNLTLTTGSFTAPTNTLTITNTFTNDATFTHNSGTINFAGVATSIGGSATSSFYNLLISSGTLTAPVGTINVAGDFTNNATYAHNSGTVNFNGSGLQTISGSTVTDFFDLTNNNTTSTVSLSSAQNLINSLTLADFSTFDANGQTFTLISDAGTTANIAAIPDNASFVGNITMQRYAPASSPTSDDWRFFSSAVSGATIADWTDNFATSGFTGATCGPTDCAVNGCFATCSYPSIYTYDETVGGSLDNGYVAATNVTNSISNGQGFWVYLGPTPVTFDVAGPPNAFTQTLSVTYTNTGSAVDDGWNLVANPYPSAIDWDEATDATHWTRTNIGGTIYIYNSSTGTYASYATGAPVNGGSRYIASQQAFWVQASGAPTLTVRELVKAPSTQNNRTFLRTAQPLNTSNYPMAFKDFPIPLNSNTLTNSIKLTSSGNGYDDETFIRFMQDATNNFDNQYDGWKLTNPNTSVQNFSSVIAGNKDLSINSLPPLTSDVVIPIRLKVPATGTYTISRDNVLMLPASSCVFLEDKKTGSMTDLRTTASYSFTISDTTVAPRFLLHISAPMTKNRVNISCAGGNNGLAIARGTGSGPWNYVWKNSAGTTVKTTTGSSSSDTLFNCTSGTYSISVNSPTCGTVTDTIIINAPAALANTISPTNISCFGGNNGSATVVAAGGSPSYSYLWSNTQTTSSISNLSLGDYSVTTTDANGCTATETVSITQPTVLTNTVSQTNASCFGGNNGTATISPAGGTPSYSYFWSNGDTVSSAINLSLGNYSVITTDANGCTTTATISITEPTALTNTVSQTNVSCFGGSDGTATVTAAGGNPSYSYLWDNGQTTLSAANLSFGNYSVTITDANGCTQNTTASITQPSALTVTTSVNSALCNSSNGDASATVGGGTSSYAYLWNDNQTTAMATGLNAGSYSVIITDANGCTIAGTANVSNIGGVTATISSSTPATCNGKNDGSAIAGISGGNPAFTYSWNTSPQQTTVSATGLPAGNYNVTVTDGTGCISIASATITEPATLVSTASQTNVSCFGGNDGSATIAPTGGTSPYTYVWNNSETTSQISDLTSQIYSVTITDANGCSNIQTVTIAQPVSPLAAGIIQTNVSCFGGSNGKASVTTTGGTPAYSYLWDNGEITSPAINLSTGIYSVTITDANGCSTSTSVSITEPAVIINSVSLTNASCSGGSNGTASVTTTGGIFPYSYLWSNGQTTSTALNLSAGNYSATITDANGCASAAAVSISQPATMVTAGFTANTYTVDIAINNSVSFTNNSSGASFYQWNFGDASGINNSMNPAHSYTSTGTYTVTLSAFDGNCSDTINKTIMVVNSNPLFANEHSPQYSSVAVIYESGEVFLLFSLDKKTQVNISVYNMIGEKISSQSNLYVKDEKIKLNLPTLSAGIYIAVSDMGDATISKKILIPVPR
ncbi:MAG: PKD domain-containing protein [Bacteroidetes bacterium]|nr:PKD domain-containing protein [Bacteroidota bacterium]